MCQRPQAQARMQMVRMQRMLLLLDPPRYLNPKNQQFQPVVGLLLLDLLCQPRTRPVPEESKNLVKDLLLPPLLDQCP